MKQALEEPSKENRLSANYLVICNELKY